MSLPDSNAFREALQKLDLLVVHDLFMTETAELAHYVLPACTHLEKNGLAYSYNVCHGIPYLMLRKKAIDPLHESWSEFRFWKELAKKMGLGDVFPWETDEEVVELELKSTGLSYKEMKEEKVAGAYYGEKKYGMEEYEKKGFSTPSRKIEIYSETFAKAGFDPLPTYREPDQSPMSGTKLYEKYPLILTTGARILYYTHAQHRNIKALKEKIPEPFAEIHPKTATQYGIKDGDPIVVESNRGKIKVKARVTQDILEGVVSIPHGWPREANVNLLTDVHCREPIMGYPQMKSQLCSIGRLSRMKEDRRYWNPIIETLPRERLVEIELTRFRELLRWAKDHSPFYKRKLHGIEPEDIRTLEDLAKVPMTEKDELRAAQEGKEPYLYGDLLAVPPERLSIFHQTSGTTGKPVYIPDTYESWQWVVEVWCYILYAAGFRPQDRVFMPFAYNVYIAFWQGHYAAEKLGCEVVPGGALDTKGRIQKMKETKATALMNTPTYGLHMAEVVKEMGIDPRRDLSIKRMICAGEPMPEPTRLRLEEEWGADVYDHIGGTEPGGWAGMCSMKKGMHVIEPHFLLEMVDLETMSKPIPPGSKGCGSDYYPVPQMYSSHPVQSEGYDAGNG